MKEKWQVALDTVLNLCQIWDRNANSVAASGSQPRNRINLKPAFIHKREFVFFEITEDRPRSFQNFRN